MSSVEDLIGAAILATVDDITSGRSELEVTDEAPDLERRRASSHRGAGYMEDETYPPGGDSGTEPEDVLGGYSWEDIAMAVLHPSRLLLEDYQSATSGGSQSSGTISPSGSPPPSTSTSPPKSRRSEVAEGRLRDAQAALARAQSREKYVAPRAQEIAPTQFSPITFTPPESTMSTDSTVLGSMRRLREAGLDVLGGGPPKKGGGKKAASGVGKKSPHRRALSRALRVARRAEKASKLATAKASTYKSAQHVVRGVILGVAVKVPTTAAQKAAAERLKKAATRHAQAVGKAKAMSEKAGEAAKKLRSAVQKAGPLVTKLVRPKMKSVIRMSTGASTQVKGDEVFGGLEYRDAVEDILGEALLILGAGEDEDYGDDAGADEGNIPMPIREQTLTKDEANAAWANLPIPAGGKPEDSDAVVYDGERGWPEASVGSWNMFYGDKDGFYQGPNNQWWVYFGNRWFPADARNPQAQAARAEIAKFSPRKLSLTGNIVFDSAEMGWGPIIGNPTGPLKGLQYATAVKKWFWQADKAPKWATEEADKQIALLNKQTQEAADAAAAAEAARIEQETADMEEQQAKQDFAIQMAETKAEAEQAIARGQLEQQQAAAESQIAVEQAKRDLAAQDLELKRAAAEQALEAQAAKATIDYAIAHPEETMAETQAPASPEAALEDENTPVEESPLVPSEPTEEDYAALAPE